MTERSAPDYEEARSDFDALVGKCADYLTQGNLFHARQSLNRALRVEGVNRSEAMAIAARLGAAEAALWLRRFAEQVVPTQAEFANNGSTVGFALTAWLSPELHNDDRWKLFDEAGGDRALLTNSSMMSIAKLAKSLRENTLF